MFMFEQVSITYEFIQVRFKSSRESVAKHVEILGVAKADRLKLDFSLKLVPIEQLWALHSFKWDKNVNFDDTIVLKKMVDHATRLLGTINILPTQDVEGGAKLSMFQENFPGDATNKTIISIRPNMLSMRCDKWSTVWEQIEERLTADDCFRVQGIEASEVLEAVKILRTIFPSDWIKASLKNGKATAAPT